jgi:putative CocE/NonD family hydrolase
VKSLRAFLLIVISAPALAQHQEPVPPVDGSITGDDARRYDIQTDVLIKTQEGATLSAVVVRKKGVATRQPAALYFTIYTNLSNALREAKQWAEHGYAGVVADTRGKRLSPDEIAPWEHEVADTYGVIDWISRQSWSDGQVGMYGDSYIGFAQWAAAKSLHPALKTILPSVANNPGLGLPLENNVFQNGNYAWVFYVANNKYLDDDTYHDAARWGSLNTRWYTSGRPYREIDRVDGTANPILQRQLRHPSYDSYWQRMTPYRQEFAKINIPVLSITGYFEDNLPTLNYLSEHYKYNPHANHYLVVGPYDHFGARAAVKPAVVNGYGIDSAAQFDTEQLRYEWFDYVMRGGPKPALLQDKINYQVMGANLWRHAPSIQQMSKRTLTLYLSNAKVGDRYRLAQDKPANAGYLEQTVDFADRKTTQNLYPGDVVLDKIDVGSGFSFVSDAFDEPTEISGVFSGVLSATINKRDMDITLAFYEITPAGEFFNLSYYLGRASYARDMGARTLLVPGNVQSIPFDRTRLVSRQLAKGSRLLVLLTVNKNEWAQVNYGTGKDVSDESIADAGVPLKVRWGNDSFVRVPIEH